MGGAVDSRNFTAWLVENGGFLHPNVEFLSVPYGFNIVASHPIAADETVVSCPFSLAITPTVSRKALEVLLGLEASDTSLSQWSERQLICSYLCMHKIVDAQTAPVELAHRPYVDILPSPEKLRTPLHFAPAELELFKGSNLYGATSDRRRDWEAEWIACRDFIASRDVTLATRFTWDQYLTAATYISSRAFPSTLLSANPTLVSSPQSYPILLPGVDSLNHARAQPVSWVVSCPRASDSNPHGDPPLASSSISLVLHTPTAAGHELFNNYGPKPNAELILGYGFALPHNPDDTIVLKVGGQHDAMGSGKWEVGRNAHGLEPLWDALKAVIRAGSDAAAEEEESTFDIETEFAAIDLLGEMTTNLRDRLPPESAALSESVKASARPDVLQMLDWYLEGVWLLLRPRRDILKAIQGQRDILDAMIDFTRAKEEIALGFAEEHGIKIGEDDDEI